MRVFLADDSILIRNIVKEILEGAGIEICGEASNGEDALARIPLARPDVVMMDVDMPVMNGLEATSRIAAGSDVPVVVFTHNEDPALPFKALGLGARDFLRKPDFSDINKPEYVRSLVSRLEALVSGNGAGNGREGGEPGKARSADGARAKDDRPSSPPRESARVEPGVMPSVAPRADIVVIGASTGGPQALSALLAALPRPYPLPISVVQHIETGFDRSFAEWLGAETGHDVRLAREGEAPAPGSVRVAPTDTHLAFRDGRYALDDGPKVQNQKPSVDVLFSSAAERWKAAALGVLLTGMGSDGADGCGSILRAGGFAVAQDRATSMIWGMPRAAVERGAASAVLSLSDIGTLLRAVAEASRG